MQFVILSAFLFGLVHPGSKFFLDLNISLEVFCILYVLIRLIVQIPIVVATKQYKLVGAKDFKVVLALGLIGASLQLSEFYGIADGEDVSKVTFLVYTHPIWSLVFSKIMRRERYETYELIQLALAFLGIWLLLGASLSIDLLLNNKISLIAGVLIALWVIISSKIRSVGFTAIKTSFYYDLMSFVCLMIYLSINSKTETLLPTVSSLSLYTFFGLVLYSVFIGLIPNLLFYKGAERVGSIKAGYILLLEPVISSAFGKVVWNEPISNMFVFGAILLLLVNLPKTVFKNFRRFYVPVTAGIIAIFLTYSTANARTIVLFEIIPVGGTAYTISSEKKQIEIAAELALADIRAISKCELGIEKILKVGSEEDLSKEILNFQNSTEKLIIGLSRSNFARVAAKAAQGTNIKAISVGASASNLALINPNFMTVVNPWEMQFAKIREVMIHNRCTKDKTLGVFNNSDFLSNNFFELFKVSGLGRAILVSDFKHPKNIDCIFWGISFSSSEKLFSKLGGWKGIVMGTGDWNIHSVELEKIVKDLSSNITVTVPTGWIPSNNVNSKLFARRFKDAVSETASPIAAYVYDAVLLGFESLCNKKDIFRNAVNNELMLRQYTAKTINGNILSPMFLRTLKGQKL